MNTHTHTHTKLRPQLEKLNTLGQIITRKT